MHKKWESSLHIVRALCSVCVCVFGFCLFIWKPRWEKIACLGKMYHHYGMDVIVLYCWVNTAVCVFNICLMDRFAEEKHRLPFFSLFSSMWVSVGNKLRCIKLKMIRSFVMKMYRLLNTSELDSNIQFRLQYKQSWKLLLVACCLKPYRS